MCVNQTTPDWFYASFHHHSCRKLLLKFLTGDELQRAKVGHLLNGLKAFSKSGIPSGKLLHDYGKSPFSMGKSTINGHFQ